MDTLGGKVVLVTGGARGIGLAYSASLLRHGSKVAICDIIDDVGQKAEEELGREFGRDKCFFRSCDVTDPEQFEECFKEVINKYGGLDIVVNNAAVLLETQETWQREIQVNINGTINGMILGVKYMSREEGHSGGTILNTGSATALGPFPIKPVYVATKAAILSFTRSMAVPYYYERFGIRFLTLLPGFTDTPILQQRGEYLFPGPGFPELSKRVTRGFVLQTAEEVAEGLIQALKEGENGSVWLVENKQPPKRINL